MALLTNPSALISRGVLGLFRGLRLGNQRSLYLGAGFIAYGLLKRASRPERKLLSRQVIRPGQALVIREPAGDEERLTVYRGEASGPGGVT